MANTKIPVELSSTPGIVDNSNATAITIDSSERVGIGTSSPQTDLHVDSGDAGVLLLSRTSANTSGDLGILRFGNTDYDSNLAEIIAIQDGSQTNAALTFKTQPTGGATTERMRIDSSGNLLVGVTSTTIPGVSNTTAGTSLRGDDGSFFSRSLGSGDTNYVMHINRSTADGNILGFAKDGNVVGSIGTANSDLHIDGLANHSGIRFQAQSLLPRLNGSDTDNSIDLGYDDGSATHRFRNLYLSSGIYVGGSGSANHLDDYEEGTWTPTITTGSGSITLDTSEDLCSYTKIGRMVYITGRILIGAVSSPSGALQISNLPFNVTNLGDNSPSSPVLINLYNLGSAIDGVINAEMSTANYILIRENGHTTGNVANTMAENIAVGTRIGFTAVYVS